METSSNNNDFNTKALFPNIDQLSETGRSIYIKDHEFQIESAKMMRELDKMLSEDASESDIAANMENVANALNKQIESIKVIKGIIDKYILQISGDMNRIMASYENLDSKIKNDIKSININTNNRTSVFDSVPAYKERLDYISNTLIGKKSPYKDGRSSKKLNDRYTISSPKTNLLLRDADMGISYVTYPVIINPKQTKTVKIDENTEVEEIVTQKIPIKLFEFTPIKTEDEIPSFLFEIIVSGDLFSYKGTISSGSKDTNKRGVNIDSEYLINQELPFSFKVLYNEENNKVVVAFKFDETDDRFASIVKFDCSVNLLIGTDLVFANPDTVMTYNKDENKIV